MSAFTDWPGEMIRQPGTDFYTATDFLPWSVGKKGSGLVVTVPPTFRHDCSIPYGFRWLFDPNDPRYQKFSRLHDWLLSQGWSRVEAAATAHQALVADGVPLWRRLVMLLATILWKYS